MNMKFAWKPHVIQVSLNILVFMPALNPLLITQHLLLTFAPLLFPLLSDATDGENNDDMTNDMVDSRNAAYHAV